MVSADWSGTPERSGAQWTALGGATAVVRLSGMARWSTRCKSEPFSQSDPGGFGLCSCHAVWARPQCRRNARCDCVQRGRVWAPDKGGLFDGGSHLSLRRGHIPWARICAHLSPRAMGDSQERERERERESDASDSSPASRRRRRMHAAFFDRHRPIYGDTFEPRPPLTPTKPA